MQNTHKTQMPVQTPVSGHACQRLARACVGVTRIPCLRRPLLSRNSSARAAVRPQQQQEYAAESEVIEAEEDSDEDSIDELEASFQEADDLDPEGREATLEDFYTPRDGTPQALLDELYSDVVYGPPVSPSMDVIVVLFMS